MTSILVADDHDLVRMGIVRMLADFSEFSVVGEAKTGEEAVELARELKPDIVLMDLQMPGIGGLEATKKVVSVSGKTRVIAVTGLLDDMFPEKLIKAGASGYVTKGAGFDEIIEAIRAVGDGQHYLSPSIAQQIALKSCGSRGGRGTPFENLSSRELQTAIFIINGAKVHEIADTFSVSPKTVNSYRYRIFEKLGINTDVELALLAVKHKVLELDPIN